MLLAVALGEPGTEPQTLDSMLKPPESPAVVRHAMASTMSTCTKAYARVRAKCIERVKRVRVAERICIFSILCSSNEAPAYLCDRRITTTAGLLVYPMQGGRCRPASKSGY